MYEALSVAPVFVMVDAVRVSKLFCVAGLPRGALKVLLLFLVAKSPIPTPAVLIVPTALLIKTLSAVRLEVLAVLEAIAATLRFCCVCRFVMSVPCVPCVVVRELILFVFVVC